VVNFSSGVVGSKAAGGAESVHEGYATVSHSFPVTLGLGGGLERGGSACISEEGVDFFHCWSAGWLLFQIPGNFDMRNHGCGGQMALEPYGIMVWGVGKGFVLFGCWRWVGRLWFYCCDGRCTKRR